MRSGRSTRPIVGSLWLSTALCLASPALAQGNQATPASAAPVAATAATPLKIAAEGVEISPSTIALDPRRGSQVVELLLTARVDPANTRSLFAIDLPPTIPQGLILEDELLDTPQADISQTGAPTGEVRQRVQLTIRNIPARLEQTSVPVRVRFGQLTRTLALSMSNVSTLPTGASLAAEPGSEQRWDTKGPIAITVIANGTAAPRLSLGAGPFIDSASKSALPVAFCLAETREGECGDEISLEANQQRTLWLKGSAEGARPGRYSGTVRLLASNGLGANPTMTLHVSHPAWRLGGLAALVAGIILSWVLTILLPHLRRRDASLIPFARLADRLNQVEADLAGKEVPRIKSQVEAVRAAITTQWLTGQHLLPGRWPAVEPQAPAEELKAHLDRQAKSVAGLELLAKAIERAQDEAQVSALDALVADDFPPFDLPAKIEAVLNPQMRFTRREELPEPPSLAVLALREDVRNGIAWVVSSLLTIAIGSVLLIDSNPAFGAWADLAAALLWGLGLSAAGAKLGELTTGQVRTALLPVRAGA